MTDTAAPLVSGAWLPSAVVLAACRGYVVGREAEAAESADRQVSGLLRRRVWWAPWRRWTMTEALARVGRPLRWRVLLAVAGVHDDRRVADLLALAKAAGPAPVWLSASDAALLARTMPARREVDR